MNLSSDSSESILAGLYCEAARRLGNQMATLTVARVSVGIFFTGVKLSNGSGGLSATPVKSMPAAVCCTSSAAALPSPGKLRGMPVVRLLEDLHRPYPIRRAIAIAALNAVIETIWRLDEAALPFGSPVEGDAFELLKISAASRVALVGAFPPYIRELRKRGQDFKILELDPSVLKPAEMPYYAPADTADQVIPWADIIITTGTTLINDTLDGLLSYARPSAQIAVIGPTTPLLPAPFIQRGVTLIGGCRVNHADELLDVLAEGASGYHFFGKSVERISLAFSPS